MRRYGLLALALLCDLTGVVWLLQGLGILPGSFMSGDILWAAIGIGLMGVSGLIIWLAFRPPAA